MMVSKVAPPAFEMNTFWAEAICAGTGAGEGAFAGWADSREAADKIAAAIREACCWLVRKMILLRSTNSAYPILPWPAALWQRRVSFAWLRTGQCPLPEQSFCSTPRRPAASGRRQASDDPFSGKDRPGDPARLGRNPCARKLSPGFLPPDRTCQV